MTKLSKGTHYGSFEPGLELKEPQIFEEITLRSNVVRRAEAFFAHPLNRALMVLSLFAFIGLMTIVVDHTSVPENHRKPIAVSKMSNHAARSELGCRVELGLQGSQLVMYHVAAPWELMVVQKWSLPIGLMNYLQRSSHNEALSKEIQQSLQRYLQEARALAGATAPFGSTRLLDDAKAFSPAVQDIVEEAVAKAMEKAGFTLCAGWESGACSSQHRDVQWAALNNMDEDVKEWFTNAISNVDSWRSSAKKHAEKVKAEAKDLKEKAQTGLDKATKEAKREYEKAKESIQDATQRLRESHHKGKKEAERRSERVIERAERDLEKRLRNAEEDYERMTRKAERDFDDLEKKAEKLMRQAERESEDIDRKADAKLERLKAKAEALCKTKCKPKPLVAPGPQGTPSPPASGPQQPSVAVPEQTAGTKDHGTVPLQQQFPRKAANKVDNEKVFKPFTAADNLEIEHLSEEENDDEPRPLKMKSNAFADLKAHRSENSVTFDWE